MIIDQSLINHAFANQAANITALSALGMAMAFMAADFRSHTSRMLGLFLLSAASAIFVHFNVVLAPTIDQLSTPLLMLAALPTVVAMLAAAEWLLAVRRTIPAGELRTGFGDRLLRTAQLCSLLYLTASVVVPNWRIDYFLGPSARGTATQHWQAWLFIVPIIGFCLLQIAALLITLRRKPEPAEQRRVLAIVIAIPFLAGALLLPFQWAFYSSMVGQIAILVGGVQYHVRQGQQAQFMTRFLAPQVAKLVKTKGLAGTLTNTTKDIAVVACDLRNFTRYAENHSPAEVITLLTRYYDAVGELAERHGATIKDYAGDGVLLLVGAPVSYADNAQRAVKLATDICRDIGQLLGEVSVDDNGCDLGIGVGVASGNVSVGVVGAQRLEYAAVGAPVNLAARLCDAAANGEVLLGPLTAERSGNLAIKSETLQLKGLAETVVVRRVVHGMTD